LKIIYLVIALISFALGLVGVVLPLLPTTPFLLLTSYCLLKSSDRLNEKFEKTKVYKVYVKPFIEKKGMTLKAKLMIQVPVSIMLLVMFILFDSNIMRGLIIALFIGKVVTFSRIKTLKEVTSYDKQKVASPKR
tara:strand:- start:97 stop:498 length:402 start_codon:yes stop_codon:yes gene_type:complete